MAGNNNVALVLHCQSYKVQKFFQRELHVLYEHLHSLTLQRDTKKSLKRDSMNWCTRAFCKDKNRNKAQDATLCYISSNRPILLCLLSDFCWSRFCFHFCDEWRDACRFEKWVWNCCSGCLTVWTIKSWPIKVKFRCLFQCLLFAKCYPTNQIYIYTHTHKQRRVWFAHSLVS